MKWFSIIAITLLMAMTGSKEAMGSQYRKYFGNEDAVSLKDLIDVYDKYASAKKDSADFDLFTVLYGTEANERLFTNEIVNDTTFALQLPEYATSSHPFLSGAEVFYNSCLLAFNVWSNHELWLRGCDGLERVPGKDVVAGIKAISVSCIRDNELRQAAKTYKDGIVNMMKRSYEDWDEEENSMDLLIAFSEKVEAKAYKYFTDVDMFVDSLDAMTTELLDVTKPTLELYKHTAADKRVEMMLHSLNNCSTFDEQCSLFLNWADCPEAELEDEWIVAVAERLMDSGKYNPCLNNIWIIWRCLYQCCYGGISRDSFIPNDLYNEMRKKCYLACLKKIEKNPQDVFAMNCAAAIGGRVNINRYGQNLFGNEALIEMHTILSGRDVEENQESIDSVSFDSVVVDSVAPGQEIIPNGDKERMDSYLKARYTIVSENGKFGIYDREKNDSVTAVDMDYIRYSHYSQPEEGLCFCYFYYEKGLQYGNISINVNDNTKVDMMADYPILVGNEEDYPLADSLISEKSYDVLCDCMVDIDGIYGQIAVIDAKTSDVLAWGALKNVGGDIAYVPLLKKVCSSETYMPFVAADCLAQSNTSLEDSVDTGQGVLELNDSVRIRDHNWRRGGYGRLTYRQALLGKSRIGMYHAMMTLPDGMDYWRYATDQTKNTNAKEMAKVFNNIFHLDSVNVAMESRNNIREIAIGMFKEGGIQHIHAPKGVELAGVYNVADDGNEQTYTFVGCFPADNPKYAISIVVMRTHKLPVSTAMVADKVNELIEWLNNK